jgi:hypothetical protein
MTLTDRTTKVLLAAIAVALWLNALNPWIRPLAAWAQQDGLLARISGDLNRIENGNCNNRRICGPSPSPPLIR